MLYPQIITSGLLTIAWIGVNVVLELALQASCQIQCTLVESKLFRHECLHLDP
jgi:hypothetical protein